MARVRSGGGKRQYFQAGDNTTGLQIIDQWSNQSVASYTYGETPDECAKLSIANTMYPIAPGGVGLDPGYARAAESYKVACEGKTEYSSFVTGYQHTGTQVVREQTLNGFGAPASIWVLDYDFRQGGDVVDQVTAEAIELTIALSTGETAVFFARGNNL